MSKWNIKLYAINFWLCFFLLAGCTASNTRSALEQELYVALEQYLTVFNEIKITFDTINLSEVMTGYALENGLDYFEYYSQEESKGNVTVRSAEKCKVEWVDVLSSGSTWAVIEAKKSCITFSQDLTTGQRTYDNQARWRIQRFLFIKEDGRWKLARILEQVSWSG